MIDLVLQFSSSHVLYLQKMLWKKNKMYCWSWSLDMKNCVGFKYWKGKHNSFKPEISQLQHVEGHLLEAQN